MSIIIVICLLLIGLLIFTLFAQHSYVSAKEREANALYNELKRLEKIAKEEKTIAKEEKAIELCFISDKIGTFTCVQEGQSVTIGTPMTLTFLKGEDI